MKANITKDMIDAISKKQIEVLDKWWKDNSTEEMRQKAEGKTIKGALAFIRSVAKKVAQNGMAMISDEDTYGLLVHYMADEPEGAEVEEDKPKMPPPPPPKPKQTALGLVVDTAKAAAKDAQNKAKAKTVEALRRAHEDYEAAKAAKAEALKKQAETQLLFDFM